MKQIRPALTQKQLYFRLLFWRHFVHTVAICTVSWREGNRGEIVNFRIICPCFQHYFSRVSEILVPDFSGNCRYVLELSVHAKIMLRIFWALATAGQFWRPLASSFSISLVEYIIRNIMNIIAHIMLQILGQIFLKLGDTYS